MIVNDAEFLDVSIADIDCDGFFKVSKNNFPGTLPVSLKLSGMLEIPYIFKTGSGYSILSCHNRIKILRESGILTLKCFVLEKPDVDIFMKHVSLKVYRNEIGPSGKLKTLFLLNTFFNIDESIIKKFCTKSLNLPFEIIENEEYLKKVMDFPSNLNDYLDEKDVSFKIIKDISLLPNDWIAVIGNWLKEIQMRINIFRMLIDNVFDIYRRGDDIKLLKSILFSDDKTLHDAVFRLRYPEYSKLKSRSDSVIGELTGGGLTIDFPEYFDRRFVTIKFDIDKKSDCNDQLKKISKINIEKLKELLSFL